MQFNYRIEGLPVKGLHKSDVIVKNMEKEKEKAESQTEFRGSFCLCSRIWTSLLGGF